MTQTSKWDCITCDAENSYENILIQNGEQVIFGYNEEYKSIFVSFRGSENIQNWISNIQVSQTTPYPEPTIAVEKGFYNLFFSLQTNIYTIIDKLVAKHHTNQLLLTGHSLGAALATLNAFDILYYQKNYKIRALITFGSPRVGNINFAKTFETYNIYTKRITHYYDIVPHVPEEFLNYRHISQEVWYNEPNTQYTLCNDEYGTEDDTCSDSCSPTKCTSTSDHLDYLQIKMGSSGYCW
jgi:predicted lipase